MKNLPEAKDYLAREGVELKGRGEWRRAVCPFPADRGKAPTLRVRLKSFLFRCAHCGAKGSGAAEFHSQLHGVSVAEARKALLATQ